MKTGYYFWAALNTAGYGESCVKLSKHNFRAAKRAAKKRKNKRNK